MRFRVSTLVAALQKKAKPKRTYLSAYFLRRVGGRSSKAGFLLFDQTKPVESTCHRPKARPFPYLYLYVYSVSVGERPQTPSNWSLKKEGFASTWIFMHIQVFFFSEFEHIFPILFILFITPIDLLRVKPLIFLLSVPACQAPSLDTHFPILMGALTLTLTAQMWILAFCITIFIFAENTSFNNSAAGFITPIKTRNKGKRETKLK